MDIKIFKSKLAQATDYVKEWKMSSACAGASLTLTLAKSHYPQLNIDAISSGKLEKNQDDMEFTKEDYEAIQKSVHCHATRICETIGLFMIAGPLFLNFSSRFHLD